MATDADLALEEIFKRDEALKGGSNGKPPVEPIKKPEEDAFKSFIYAKPDLKEKKEEGIVNVFERTGQFKGGMDKPPLPNMIRPVADKLPEEAKELLDSAYNDLVQGNSEGYRTKMDRVDVTLKQNLKDKGIAGVYAPVKVKVGSTRRNTTSGGDIVTSMLTIRNQVKLYHWQTASFARHKATDDLTASLDTLIDNFVEIYMGKYGRPKVTKTIKLSNYSESEAQRFVSKQRKFLSDVLPRKIKRSDTDLLNIRDEILGELNKVLYLFTLA
jgi:hypothetical protein